MRATPGTALRVARARRARNLALLALALAVVGLLLAWFFGDRALSWLDRHADTARAKLGGALQSKHGLEFYASFDERIPSNLITGLPLDGSGAVRVPGVFGSARRFDGRPGENLIAHEQRWSPLAREGFTLAFWAFFPEDGLTGERRLLWDRDATSGFSLVIADGRLEATFVDSEGLHTLSAPAPGPGRRVVHLAFTLGTNRATLYMNGKECAACDVVPPLALRAHHVAFGTDGHFPPALDVDEWGIWRYPLSPAEIARLATARRSIPELYEPVRAARLRFCRAMASGFRVLLDMIDALRPSGSPPAVLNQSVPVLELRLSADDRRHFRKAHLEALASGFRTKRGKRSRFVQASFGGKTERIVAWLDESVSASRLSTRPAFVLASEDGLFGDGSGLVRLFPPEQWGERRPDAARPLPLDPSTLVRLHLDGDFLGLYCLLPFETPAPPWFVTGTRDILRPDRLHFATPSSLPADGAGLSEADRETAWRKMLALLASDPAFPLKKPEALLLARRHAATREELLLPDPDPRPAPPPRNPALPAFHLYIGRPLAKLYRTDFACLRVPAGPDAAPEWLSGTGGGHGGAKLRGNTSYVHGRRRSINLKFDTPIDIPGLDTPVRHLLLLSGYADPTRLRNALSFEAFRAMSPDGPVRSAPVFWAEIYVNDAYAGVWECCPRLQDVIGESFSDLYKVRAPNGLWSSAKASAEVVDRVDAPTPSASPSDLYSCFQGIARFVTESDPATFAADAENAFDLDELVDFFLLLNFTGNEDGRVTNQYVGHRADDGRWLLLPWDYDKTFLLAPAGETARKGALSSPLFKRLTEEVPGFRDRVARRWRELRDGPFRDDALDAWLDAHAALLAPSMTDDYRVSPPIGYDGDFPSAIAALRSEIHFRLSLLDRFWPDPVLSPAE